MREWDFMFFAFVTVQPIYTSSHISIIFKVLLETVNAQLVAHGKAFDVAHIVGFRLLA